MIFSCFWYLLSIPGIVTHGRCCISISFSVSNTPANSSLNMSICPVHPSVPPSTCLFVNLSACLQCKISKLSHRFFWKSLSKKNNITQFFEKRPEGSGGPKKTQRWPKIRFAVFWQKTNQFIWTFLYLSVNVLIVFELYAKTTFRGKTFLPKPRFFLWLLHKISYGTKTSKPIRM